MLARRQIRQCRCTAVVSPAVLPLSLSKLLGGHPEGYAADESL
jgi:hypothetical protein